MHLSDFVHGLTVRKLHMIFHLGYRGEYSHHGLPHREEFLHIPGKKLRKLQKAQCLPRGRTVHKDPVIFTALMKFCNLQKGKEVFKAGNRKVVQVRCPGAAAQKKLPDSLRRLREFFPEHTVRIQLQAP